MKVRIAVCLLMGAAAASSCAPKAESTQAGKPAMADSISGSARYLERMALIPGDTFIATLEDVSIADRAAPVLGATRIAEPGQVPIKFTIAYDKSELAPGHRYSVRAKILREDKFLFISDTANMVDLANPAPLDILMRRIIHEAQAPGPEGTTWQLASLGAKGFAPADGGRPPHFRLDSSSKIASGFLGCNRFTGGYRLGESQLSFTNPVSTLMACESGAETEREFAALLTTTAGWQIRNGNLDLLDGKGNVLAKFVSLRE